MRHLPFAHLHVHSEYSLLDGACRIEPMLEKIKSMGQSSVAITDHGVMYGVLDFYKAAKAKCIRPIIGCEVYVSPRSRKDKVSGIDSKRYHLTLLCENNTGYQNLINLVSKSWTEGFYTKPRVDRELLEKYHDGIIALSGCFFGEISQNIINNDYSEAYRTAEWYRKTFGDNNYFIEVQNQNLEQQRLINDYLKKISDELSIPLVATNDSHYVNREDSETQRVLTCIQTNKTIDDKTGFDFESDEFYLKSEEEMLEAFEWCPQAVYNSAIIAERCNVEFEFGNTKLPHFDVPEGYTHKEWFNKLCVDGLNSLFDSNPPIEYINRLNYELDVINSMGYTDYYLIVRDFIKYAKDNGIPVGPGRGSGAASLCAYCIGITGIDPLKYNLLFERFLNPERVSMPDFDIDFCFERREEVIQYVIRKYGFDHVSQIVTFGTLAAKAAVRDVGRVLGISYNEVDRIAKLIPGELNMTIEKALDKSEDLKDLYVKNPNARRIIDLSKKIEGMPRHASTHAAGVVITADPVTDYVPVALNDNSVVTQFTMKGLELLGLLKMDFLGLRTLTVISNTEKRIKENNPLFSLSDIPVDDKNVYRMFSKGDTDGVFQFESSGMKRVLKQLSPESIEDIIAVISLYRPGPEKSIPLFINNRKHPENISYLTPELKPILDVTYGCIVYQEQVMQICRELAGYSYGKADMIRRAMAKKQHDIMLKNRECFLYGEKDASGNIVCEGAVNKGIKEETANKIFDEMISFASYAFNKAHAASYAFLSYQTAYLKYYYPNEYFSSLLSSFIDNSSKVSYYISVCVKSGIKIIPPHVNTSNIDFLSSERGIIFGLSAIKNIGKGFIDRMCSERERNGDFKGLYDFCKRMQGRDLNRKTLESLIKCGAFDNLGANRRQMCIAIDPILDELNTQKRNNIDGQIGFADISFGFDSAVRSDDFVFPETEDFSPDVLLNYEKQNIGFYISGHPLDKYSEIIDSISHFNLDSIEEFPENKTITLVCYIDSVNKKTSKSGSTILFADIEDETGETELVVFSSVYEKFRHLFYEGNSLIIHGKVSKKDDDNYSVICDSVEPIPPEPVKKVKEVRNNSRYNGLFLRFGSSNSPQIAVCENLLSIFEGDFPAYFFFSDNKRYEKRFNVYLNDVMIDELRNILGNDNVVIK